MLPILYGDRLIGRIDSKMDRKQQRYQVHNIYLEPDVTPSLVTAAIIGTIEELADFLGARSVDYADA